MLRAGPLSDERVVRLANRRFVSFYFDLSNRGAAGDPHARRFVVAARRELGGRAVPTPPLLFMDHQGRVLSSVSNYASGDTVLATMIKVLAKNPQYNVSAADEMKTSPIGRAQVLIDLRKLDEARRLLTREKSDRAQYLLGRLARFDKDWKKMETHLRRIDEKRLAPAVRMERAYRLWHNGRFADLIGHLEKFPRKHQRYTEARYYVGLAHFHLGDKAHALQVWKATINGCPQDPWIYRADWAYTQVKQSGKQRLFSTAGKRISLLRRIGYMGRGNPDLKLRR